MAPCRPFPSPLCDVPPFHTQPGLRQRDKTYWVRPGGIRLNSFLTRDHQIPIILLGINPKLEPPQNYKIVCVAKCF